MAYNLFCRNARSPLRSLLWALAFGLAVAFFLGGCRQETAEQKADREVHQGRYQRALEFYEDALAHSDKVSVHLKMARIYADHLHDPESAAYHYRRILALQPTGHRAELARAALRKPGPSTESENGEPVAHVSPGRVSPAAVDAERAAKAHVPVYVVQSGDTLVSISRRIYGKPERWKDILDANHNQLNRADELKPGQKIILP